MNSGAFKARLGKDLLPSKEHREGVSIIFPLFTNLIKVFDVFDVLFTDFRYVLGFL